MKKIIIVLAALIATSSVFSQNEANKWAVGGGISAIDFSGPITKSYFDFNEFKGSGRIFVGRYLNPSFNAKADFTFGKVWFPQFDVYPTTIDGLYELRHIYDAGLTFEYKFNNGYIFKENAVIAPYIFAGFGMNSIVDYDVNTYVPFGLGFNIRPSDWFTINLQSSYKLNIDNSFDYTQHSASLVFNLGGSGKKKVKEDVALDSDGDGIPDLVDECPFTFGYAQFFGCPDTDGDGIGDSRDLCPNEAGPIENRGCPIVDSDGDGVPDDQDACPFEFGEKRYAGCPDTDGDGIIDKYDKCPTVAGPASNDGCPLEEEVKPTTPTTPISPTTPTKPVGPALASDYVVFYPSGGSALTNADRNKLDRILAELNANPSWKVKIKGYTDDTGNEISNQTLSLRRAQDAWKYLSSKGLDGRRVELYGMGPYFPQSSNRNENRRVEVELVK
jgi:OOP family OmpA-OmpF porin